MNNLYLCNELITFKHKSTVKPVLRGLWDKDIVDL